MGLFLHAFLFPGGEEENCRAALERVSEDPELSVRPDECRWQTFAKGPAVLLNDGSIGFEAAGRLSDALDIPVMSLYIYDDDFWGYDLWRKGRALDQFASVHDYFDAGQPPDRRGDARTVARCFDVEPRRIARYLIPWDEARMDQYAYEGDKAVIGDSWQMADFMDALGFDFDRLSPPDPEPEPRPEPVKEPNRPAVTMPESLPRPELRPDRRRKVEDTPILPSALTSRSYAFQRVLMLGEAYQELLPLLQYAKYQDAVSNLTEAIQSNPDEAGFYLLRAFCWKQLEGVSARSRTPDMIRDLSRALELEPDNVMALRGRSSLTTTSARYPRQIQDLNRQIDLDPENRDLHQVARAYFRHWLKDDEAARADLEEVLRRGELWTVDLVYLCGELGLPGF